MGGIVDWLRSGSSGVADAIVKLNADELVKESISGFGMKARVVELLDELRAALFPTLYEKHIVDAKYLHAHVLEHINASATMLDSIIREVLINRCEREQKGNCDCAFCSTAAEGITLLFMKKLPDIRKTLSTDIKAAYLGDPAAVYTEEILLSYPSIEAVTIYRLAHELSTLHVPLIPRIMTEHAHQLTGIDIHPGAKIGDYFFIDHGTGVVIGETCVIGSHVKLYQGVTLGAKSFELDSEGNPVKGVKRHPNIEDNVIIYAGATILGGQTTIGRGSVIGGNVWLTHSVPPNSTIYNDKA